MEHAKLFLAAAVAIILALAFIARKGTEDSDTEGEGD